MPKKSHNQKGVCGGGTRRTIPHACPIHPDFTLRGFGDLTDMKARAKAHSHYCSYYRENWPQLSHMWERIQFCRVSKYNFCFYILLLYLNYFFSERWTRLGCDFDKKFEHWERTRDVC